MVDVSRFYRNEQGLVEVFDISTDSGVFAAGVGGILVHNTDFCMQMLQKKPDTQFILNNKVKVVHLNERKNQVGDFWIKNQNFFAKKWKGLSKVIARSLSFPLRKRRLAFA